MNSSSDSKAKVEEPEKQQVAGQQEEPGHPQPQQTSSNNQQQLQEQEFDENKQVNENGKNANQVECPQCRSVVFRSATAEFQRGPSIELPLPYQKRQRTAADSQEMQTEPHDQWWTVTDMFTFENVGFTHSFQGRKFLACADCEIGPIGLVCPDTGKFMVAIGRVQTALE